MKRIMTLYTVIIISLLMNTTYAQWSIGIIGGPNFADLEINFVDNTITDYDVQSRTLFGVGGFFGIYLNEYLSIQLELMYVEKGGVFTQASIPDMRIKSNQIELPLILKAGIGENIRAYIIGGVFLSFVLDATVETELAGLSLEGDLTEILKKTEFGSVFGAGISIPVWKGSAFIEGRYNLGLTNLNKGGNINLTNGNLLVAGPQTDPQDEIKTMGIQIMLGYQLPLGWE
ncbi:MAG: porin family protein [Ignavibacteriaceae bacterium]